MDQNPPLKDELHRQLRVHRAAVVSTLDGLSDYDMRRPMTPTGTNLLGLVKHLAGLEYGYLGECFDRIPPETMSWIEDGSIWDGADMWATAEEASADLLALYSRACAHADATIEALDLETRGHVDHWPEERRSATLGVLLVRMVSETARHCGHADIVREMIDGRGGPDHDSYGDDAAWDAYVDRIRVAADAFRTPDAPPG
jgi:hypothetical protein